MKPIIHSILLALLLSSTPGCIGVDRFAAKTTASYEITPEGARKISYESNKEQNGLDATYELDDAGKVKAVHIKVDRAGTQESVVAAALQQQIMMGELLKVLLPVIKDLATKAAPLAAGS